MKNKIEITAVNGFELLFESEYQEVIDQEININLNKKVYTICVDIQADYIEKETFEDQMQWVLDDIFVTYQTAYNEDGFQVVLSKTEQIDIESYLEVALKH